MNQVFPSKLIARCQQLIFKRSGIRISEDEAVFYLEKFGRLMKTAIKITQQMKSKQNEKNNTHQ